MNPKINVNEDHHLNISEQEMNQAMEAANRLAEEEGIYINFVCI